MIFYFRITKKKNDEQTINTYHKNIIRIEWFEFVNYIVQKNTVNVTNT